MILCVGLTPTVQRTLFFDAFSVGAVNRARETRTTASGKGVNVARVATGLGESVRLIQILGGDSGRWLIKPCNAKESATRPFGRTMTRRPAPARPYSFLTVPPRNWSRKPRPSSRTILRSSKPRFLRHCWKPRRFAFLGHSSPVRPRVFMRRLSARRTGAEYRFLSMPRKHHSRWH